MREDKSKNTNDLHVKYGGLAYHISDPDEFYKNIDVVTTSSTEDTGTVFKFNLDPIREYDWKIRIECYTHTYSSKYDYLPSMIGNPKLNPLMNPDPNVNDDVRKNYLWSKDFEVKLKCPEIGIQIFEPFDIVKTQTHDVTIIKNKV